MAIRRSAVRNLIGRSAFIEQAAMQFAVEGSFQRAASAIYQNWRGLGVTFNETQVALSRALQLIRAGEGFNIADLPGKTLVRDFPLVSSFEDVVGLRSRFVVGIQVDMQRFTGSVLSGRTQRFTFEFNRPPTMQEIRDRLEAFRPVPKGRRYERLRAVTENIELDFSAVSIEFALRIT